MAPRPPWRLLYVSCYNEFGGTETSLLSQLKYLDRKRFAPAVAYPPVPLLVERLRDLGVPYEALPPLDASMRDHADETAARRLARSLDALGAIPTMLSLLRRQRPHLVHARGSRAAKLLAVPCLIAGVPLTWSAHNTYAPTVLDRLLPRVSKASIFVSQAVRRVYLRDAETAPRWQVIHNGVDLTLPYGRRTMGLRAQLGLAEDDLVVGLVGRITGAKGHHVLIQAAKTVAARYPRCRYLIVGQPGPGGQSYQADLKRMVSSLDLERAFIWAGFRDDIPSILGEMDLLVLPSESEGFPMVPLEAMAAMKPVVVTDLPAAVEVVADGLTGLRVTPGDPGALAEAIVALLGDASRRLAMGRAGRETVERSFDVRTQTRIYEALFESVIRERYGRA